MQDHLIGGEIEEPIWHYGEETAEIDSQLGANPWNLPPLISMAYILLITLTKFPALIRRRPSHESYDRGNFIRAQSWHPNSSQRLRKCNTS
jgi:hypothetical protein